jgi:hypothetical protein
MTHTLGEHQRNELDRPLRQLDELLPIEEGGFRPAHEEEVDNRLEPSDRQMPSGLSLEEHRNMGTLQEWVRTGGRLGENECTKAELSRSASSGRCH